jgi:hypothetical protein
MNEPYQRRGQRFPTDSRSLSGGFRRVLCSRSANVVAASDAATAASVLRLAGSPVAPVAYSTLFQ